MIPTKEMVAQDLQMGIERLVNSGKNDYPMKIHAYGGACHVFVVGVGDKRFSVKVGKLSDNFNGCLVG